MQKLTKGYEGEVFVKILVCTYKYNILFMAELISQHNYSIWLNCKRLTVENWTWGLMCWYINAFSCLLISLCVPLVPFVPTTLSSFFPKLIHCTSSNFISQSVSTLLVALALARLALHVVPLSTPWIMLQVLCVIKLKPQDYTELPTVWVNTYQIPLHLLIPGDA